MSHFINKDFCEYNFVQAVDIASDIKVISSGSHVPTGRKKKVFSSGWSAHKRGYASLKTVYQASADLCGGKDGIVCVIAKTLNSQSAVFSFLFDLISKPFNYDVIVIFHVHGTGSVVRE